MLARSMTESEIAEKLCVNQSTISRDIKALEWLSQRFVYDLVKSDLASSKKVYTKLSHTQFMAKMLTMDTHISSGS
jgi:hypothetical protein